jgi:hypothetical protein
LASTGTASASSASRLSAVTAATASRCGTRAKSMAITGRDVASATAVRRPAPSAPSRITVGLGVAASHDASLVRATACSSDSRGCAGTSTRPPSSATPASGASSPRRYCHTRGGAVHRVATSSPSSTSGGATSPWRRISG